MNLTKREIQDALGHPGFNAQVAQEKMTPRPRGGQFPGVTSRPRLGGVLLMLYPKDGQTNLVLTRRRDDLQSHAGQISFPGGQREGDESLEQTALREANEEIGVKANALYILGRLATLYIPPSDYEVHPYVAWHQQEPMFTPQYDEVAEIIEVSLEYLLDPANRYEEPWTLRGYEVQVPYFLVKGHKVWGATAMMLSDFLERLRAAGFSSRS
jgi:8-oxo-dGTP pyrophosphatase MutT (NUDIX family)